MRAPFLALLVLCAAVAAACGGGNAQQAGPGGAGGRGGFPAMDVKTVTLTPKPIPQTSEFVATIKSLRSTNIQPQVDGFVRQIMVKAGDRVRAGQPLLQIDPDKQQATVATTQSQRAERDADLAFARQQLARVQKLFDAGAVSRQELEQAETNVKTAEAQLEAVASQIRESQVQLQYYRVTAPTDGIVGDIEIRQGEHAIHQAGIQEASTTEFGETPEPVVGLITEWMSEEGLQKRARGGDLGGTMRLGAYPAKLTGNSVVHSIYGSDNISERHRHRYEVNIHYKDQLESTGLLFSGMSPDGQLPEIVERPDHPWFVGVQFHPELKSRPFEPHPLFASFVEAALKQSRLV